MPKGEPLGADLIEAVTRRIAADPAVGPYIDGPFVGEAPEPDAPVAKPARPFCWVSMEYGPLPEYALFYVERDAVYVRVSLFGASAGAIAPLQEHLTTWFNGPPFPLGTGDVLYGYVDEREVTPATESGAAADRMSACFYAQPSAKRAGQTVTVTITPTEEEDDEPDVPAATEETETGAAPAWYVRVARALFGTDKDQGLDA